MKSKIMRTTNKNKQHLFFEISLKFEYLLIISLIATFVLIKVTVIGLDMISGSMDSMIKGENVNLYGMIPTIGGIILVGTVVSFIKTFCAGKYSNAIQKEFKERAIDKITKLEYKYFDEEGSGGVITKFISDIHQAEYMFTYIIPQFFATVITIVTVLIYIIRLNLKLALAILITYPIVLIVTYFIGNILEKLTKGRRGKVDVMTGIANDCIAGIAVVRSYNLFETVRARLNDSIDAIMKNEYYRAQINQLSYTFRYIAFWIPNIICPIVALYMLENGQLSIGGMTSYIVLMNRIIGNMQELPAILNDGIEVKVSIDRLEDVFYAPAEKSGFMHISDIKSEFNNAIIELKNLSFSYDECNEQDKHDQQDECKENDKHNEYDKYHGRKIFDGMSFSIEKGKTTAIVGGSGEGKTTLFKILCGFYKQQQGIYRLYGTAFQNWDIKEARSLFSLVSQNVFLFPGTIYENVAYGKKGATTEEIIDACKMANIHMFIEKLPEGYETMTGERGVKLSGGECQRISIARAILKNAPILLMDEPTSAVDVATEKMIQEAIENISRKKTVIIIAHRLSTIQYADRILVFENGKLAEQGNHQALLLKNGKYADLYHNELSVKAGGKTDEIE